MTREQIKSIRKGCEGEGRYTLLIDANARSLCDLALAGLDAEARIATLEARAAIDAALARSANEAFLEGRRFGAADMRERAAKYHDDEVVRLNGALDDPGFDGNRRAYADNADDHEMYAAAIRALPIEGGE